MSIVIPSATPAEGFFILWSVTYLFGIRPLSKTTKQGKAEIIISAFIAQYGKPQTSWSSFKSSTGYSRPLKTPPSRIVSFVPWPTYHSDVPPLPHTYTGLTVFWRRERRAHSLGGAVDAAGETVLLQRSHWVSFSQGCRKPWKVRILIPFSNKTTKAQEVCS